MSFFKKLFGLGSNEDKQDKAEPTPDLLSPADCADDRRNNLDGLINSYSNLR